jgi:hypothetical protein
VFEPSRIHLTKYLEINLIKVFVICGIHIVTNMTIAWQRLSNTRSRGNEQTRKSIVSQWLAKHIFRSNR